MKTLIAIGALFSITPQAFSEEPIVSTEIVTIALDRFIGDLYFDSGDGISLFQATPSGLGQPLKYKGPQRLILRKSEAEFSAEPPLPAPHASVKLPLRSERVLLACVNREKSSPKIAAFDIGKSKIDAGQYRFFNFSSSVIAVKFGNRKLVVKPGKEALVSDPVWKNEVTEIDLMMGVVKGDKTKPVYSSQWGNRPGRRNYIFMFDGAFDYKPIKIRRFFDVPPSEPENNGS